MGLNRKLRNIKLELTVMHATLLKTVYNVGMNDESLSLERFYNQQNRISK